MRSSLSIAILLVLFSIQATSFLFTRPSSFKNFGPLKDSTNPKSFSGGGWTCFWCMTLVSQSITYSYTHQIPVDDFIKNELCTFFKAPLNSACTSFVNNFGDAIIDALDRTASPDAACNEIKWCTNPQCFLYPNHTFSDKINLSRSHTPNSFEAFKLKDVQEFDPWAEFKNWLNSYNNDERPDIDFDNDTFSYYEGYARGYNWKGRDCNDFDAQVYPGRAVNPHNNNNDYNCNGIYGLNQTLNKPWEDILCANSSPMGVIVLGDSGGAHFELPYQWFNGSDWTKDTWADYYSRKMDEFDLPQYSGYTSFYPEGPNGPAHSIYQYMYQRNKCNFRDYQNGAKNGKEAVNELETARLSIRRNQTTDHPVLLFLELIGNDVCSGGDGMTNSSDFQAGILETLQYLDTILPNGSKVFTIGFANGTLLYEYLHNATHPLNVSYVDFWTWMTCVDINPCNGWLTSNATTRENTQQRANNLSLIYQQLIDTVSFKNFEYAYFPFPTNAIFNQWMEEGNNPADLIEPVDGFHPNQMFHSLMADYFWNQILSEYSDWIGPVNPNNDLITQLFGNQGGY